MENSDQISVTDANVRSAQRDKFTRRGFMGIGSAALAAAGIVPAMAADRSRSDPGPGDPALDAQNPDYPFSLANKRAYEGGWSREVTVRELPVSKSMAGVNMRLTAGGVREMHWHTAGEWAIMLYGTARITAIDADGKSFVADVKKDDLWYFPSGIPHSIQGLEPDGAEFMLVFDDGDFSESDTVLLSDSMAHIPHEVLSKNFGVAEKAFAGLPGTELFIFQTAVPGSLNVDQTAAAGTLGASPENFAFRTMERAGGAHAPSAPITTLAPGSTYNPNLYGSRDGSVYRQNPYAGWQRNAGSTWQSVPRN